MTIININKIYLTIIWLHLVIFKTQKTFISPNLQAYYRKNIKGFHTIPYFIIFLLY